MDRKSLRALLQLPQLTQRLRLWRSKPSEFAYEPALRAELFSAEQMASHGTHLAGQHHLSPHSAQDSLLARLTANHATLARSCELLNAAALSNRRVTPAGEWLLDNFYLIEEQIRTAQKHLPKGYSSELPRLASGPSASLPRVYDIALETIAHGDARVDSESLSRFVGAYQSVMPLTLGELWAIPIMLRLALIENLRRVASRVMANWVERDLANDWADRITETIERAPKDVVLAIADMARSNPPMSGSFVAELARRLQGQNSALALPLTWIEQHLAESGQSIERLVQLDVQQQAADQVSISNSIGSLRLLAATDWRDFVERLSLVEQQLRKDPQAIYPAMDFATRDHYRHAIERLARNSKHSETAVAEAVLELAEANAAHGIQGHVGYYLIDQGLAELERRLGSHAPFAERWQSLLQRAPQSFYFIPVVLLTGLFAWPFILMAWREQGSLAMLALGLAIVLMTSRLALSLINWLVTLTVTPDVLPRMDYRLGIPTRAMTLVVVPTLIGSAQDVDELVEGLEVRYLANRDANLAFALLTDFMDAASEEQPEDAELLHLARERLESLNRKYADGEHFFLLHRARRWNPAEQTWMGHERKRGKLMELNALLRGQGRERFALIVGDIATLPRVRYVITLDTDTQLPRDTARQFIGAIDHPLNQAQYDPQQGRIVRGYAILQPRVGISLPSTARSPYAQLLGSDAGVDPYTRAVSDVYQDLFQQGSFIGKGIYAVDAFEQALAGNFPDNRILSHDLIEGCYARCGLLSDVQLYEEFPSCYSSDVKRRHRWIRGDWQLLPWMLPWTPTSNGGLQRSGLAALARWKILDNLRRSLEPAAFLLVLLNGWLLGSQPLLWTLAVLALIYLPSLLGTLLELLRKPHELSLAQHLRVVLRSAGQHGLRASLSLLWLPHEAHYSLDALLRSLWRMLVSKRRLLQWSPSREVERSISNELSGLYRLMWVAPLLSLGLFALLLGRPQALVIAAPLLLLWLLSPAIAWYLSRPPAHKAFAPEQDQQRFLRALSRRTWGFFERFVSAEDNWLPPDNIQEQPSLVIAHRTSPTNMGLSLLAHLAARDFGYISAGHLLARLEPALLNMHGLQRYRRHFYNWYDTQTLMPIQPHYISAVDSGNLAGHLLTLRPGLLALAASPVDDARLFAGLGDCLAVLQDALAQAQLDGAYLQPWQAKLAMLQAQPPSTLAASVASLDELLALTSPWPTPGSADSAYWQQALLAQCREQLAELQALELPAGVAGPAHPSWQELASLDPQLWPEAARGRVAEVQQGAARRIATAARLAQLAATLADMDFDFLYDRSRDLFAIGYNTDERRLDSSYYDLLASEARLTSFVAIAQGQTPQEGWFSLGRLLTSNNGVPVLLSWSGSMFEYLMPMLVMPNYQGTLLDHTCRAAVARQIEYGRLLGLPWGVSESGYITRDVHLNYQYRAFGVPGLGLKRGLAEDLVIAPYASALALLVEPEAATQNLQRLAGLGLAGRFGLYEAIDYTAARLPRGQSSEVVYSYMAHHQGMSLLALASVLLDRPMQRRFESDPQFQASALLLQERIPHTATEYLHTRAPLTAESLALHSENTLRVFSDPARQVPAVQLLSNGRYHVMVSSAGGGYSRCGELALTRWHEDVTCDNWGMFCYLRDIASGDFWSSAHQPTLIRPECYEAIFSDARAEFRVSQHDFNTHTEIVVSPEDDIELRRLTITNQARVRRSIELTSYAEIVLAPAISDALHPAFSNLFVQTEIIRPLQAIVCTRRPRSDSEATPWMCHLLAAHGVHIDSISYETDRARFIGRGHNLAHPQAMERGGASLLSGSQGSVLDPIVAIRCRITLDPGQSASIDLVSGLSDSREGCLQLIDKYRDRHLASRVFDLAWTHSQVLLRQLNASLADARLYEQMAASVLYANPSLRAESAVIASNGRNQSGLWGQAISGDLPIVLVQIGAAANIELVRQLVQAHSYWRHKGLAVDLVIWNEDHAGYRQHLQDLIIGLISSNLGGNPQERPGGIFVCPTQQLSSEDRNLMQAVARIILSDSRGSLGEQLQRRRVQASLPRFDPSQLAPLPAVPQQPAGNAPALQLGNPYGGFSADGSEYVINLQAGSVTPAPWVNVLANPHFGTVISESGSAYSWYENAHEFRLSPWLNDPVSDASGEACYLRDEESGHYWSPTPWPRRGNGNYSTRHGFGYSLFEHEEDGIHSELWVFVALDTPVKYSLLKVRNNSKRKRSLSATGYVEWVLGDLRSKAAMHLVTSSDPVSGALLVRNAFSMEFSERVAFFNSDPPGRCRSGDRSEFIGRNGNLHAPAGMTQARLSGRMGGGLDPCAAIQVGFELAPGASQDIVFCLGAEQNGLAASRLLARSHNHYAANSALNAVRQHWRSTLGKVQVQTPDPALNLMANGWLLYQVIACRFWARSGYYQSGGAYGFRDQLQDSMAMLHAAPALARQHLLNCAAHQFIEGDVQHWWHPPMGRGVRTACSDDYLWLALATCRYVHVSGDYAVLDATLPYLEGRALNEGEESYYDLPKPTALHESLYQHCQRAIEHGLARGPHGLPLMGSGDWNDGMNKVGERGQGESIWLGFFQYQLLKQFAGLARTRQDHDFAERCSSQAALLREQLELHGWDGQWYRRAYFDDGTPLGSAGNSECRIDSLAQSWSVLSGAAPDGRRRQAMAALDQYLVQRDSGVVQLLTPPFDHMVQDPGYIKGYVPGVRENGGQYTHAAIWACMAFAELGDGKRAWELLGMLNPARHGLSAKAIEQYKVEPYVVAADVYAMPPHVGRGGWSWYTGAAGWMYRLMLESLLGLQRNGRSLRIQPLLPEDWPGFTLHYRFESSDYRIQVSRAAAGVSSQQVRLDGVLLSSPDIPLVDDGHTHRVDVQCCTAASSLAQPCPVD